MKNLLISAALTMISSAAMAQFDSAPAFPGAEGFGRYVTGGRGGKIVHVTNLNDHGAGSFREAVHGDEKKIVVFDVGGIIALESELKIGKNTTVEGQTAPGEGITLRYFTVRPQSNNIVRFLRFRHGEERQADDGSDAIWNNHQTGIIIDHCSMSWSLDELASFYDNNNFTMQWCALGEALNAGHSKGEHSYGGIWGGKLASFHHNFLLHMINRVPRFCGARYQWGGYTNNHKYGEYNWQTPVQAEIVDFRNCVMYNYTGGCYGGPGGGYVNMVNNYFKAGPAKTSNKTVTTVTVGAPGNSAGHPEAWGMTSRYYIKGNYVTAAGNNARNYDWTGVKYDSGTFEIDGEKWSLDTLNLYGSNEVHKNNANGKPCIRIKMDAPVTSGDVTTHSAETSYNKVLAFSGASYHRDNVDSRFADEARNGTYTYEGSEHGYKGIIYKVADQGEYSLPTASRGADFDTDRDGMPDEWERANGLNPDDASDAKAYTLDARGYYTNVEVYCNSIVEHIMKAGNADAETTFEEYYPVLNTTAINNVSVDGKDRKAEKVYTLGGYAGNNIGVKGVYIKGGRKYISKMI
ncbi:MAG: pectate lyase [Prevotella sp.]|nr:pectate lyase [Prevotella sp.]